MTITVKAKGYSEANIERFAGLEGIRKKPTPYIGPTDGNGLWTIFREPADNAVDQALAGRNKMVHLVYDKEPNRYWVLDAGEGIPVGRKEFTDERGRKEKLSTLYVVTGLTHGGSNFSGDTISRGTHGIGIKATNAMSTFFKVWTFRDGSWWAIEYKSGKMVKDVHKTTAPKMPHGINPKKGTVVCFTPELPLFVKNAKINIKDVREWCQLTSYLVPGLEVRFTSAEGKTHRLIHKRGPIEFIEKRVAEFKAGVTGKPFVFSSKEADIAVAFTDAEGTDLINAYTNGLKNSEGGEHVRALMDALVKSLVPYKGKLDYTPTDLREGVLGLVNYKISAPQFNNQPKDKLIDERVYSVAFPQFVAAWSDFWNKNKTMAKDIVTRASELRKKTAEFLKDKKLIKNVKSASSGMAAKLAAISGNSKVPVAQRELYLVEGDSAGGTAELARFKDFQATFKVSGKPLNVMEATKDAINKNKGISMLLAAIGLDMSKADPIASLGYGRIIYLADPDVDGKHIQCLLSALFWKFLPQLFKAGRIFIVQSPEYMAKHKGKTLFGDNKAAIYKQAGTMKVDIRHIKGWAEISPEPMREIAFQIGQRKLLRVNPPKDKAGAKRFEALMGKDAEYRKKLLGVV